MARERAVPDVSTNPEIALLSAEDNEAECDELESYWLAGQAVTTTKHSNYDEKEPKQ